MASQKPVRKIDARSLRALAHPLRVRMLDVLRTEGPATSARLAERFGESTGTVSWHLRHLAEHGFIAEDVERGTRRERWWQASDATHVVETAELRKDPGARAAVDAYIEEMIQQGFRRARTYFASRWPEEWERTGTIAHWDTLKLTPQQLQALNQELMAVVEKHTPAEGAEPEPGALPVSVQLQSFPRLERND
ncbi:winged helix-turn-helix domain-containing protein [Streptomyces sp. NPDC060194]|uniref:winged helix-turn-helix domain-containing protein n=1 Tax=Streptomyces sp. NPDC060194 TaxID=3347069 RepID=UPI00366160AA